MTIKTILDSIDDLPEALRGEYSKGEDGKFHLDLDDGGETKRLMAKHGEAEKHRKNAEAKLKELQEQMTALEEERDGMLKGTVSKDDLEKLESSYKSKLEKAQTDAQQTIDSLQGNLRNMLVDSKAQAMASELSDYGDVLMPHIKGRLKADMEDGKAVTRVLDANGDISAMTVDDLKAEIQSDARFAPIIRGSQASGGGANGSGKPNGAMKAGDFGGSKEERQKAIAAKYPELEA